MVRRKRNVRRIATKIPNIAPFPVTELGRRQVIKQMDRLVSVIGLILTSRKRHVIVIKLFRGRALRLTRSQPLQRHQDKRDRENYSKHCQQSGCGWSPSGPLECAFPGRASTCLDRFPAMPAFQILRQRLGGSVTPARIFLQAFQSNRLDVAVDTGCNSPRANWLFLQKFHQGIQWRLRPERGAAGQQFIKNRPQAIDIDGGA